jgi:hypothetical protein
LITCRLLMVRSGKAPLGVNEGVLVLVGVLLGGKEPVGVMVLARAVCVIAAAAVAVAHELAQVQVQGTVLVGVGVRVDVGLGVTVIGRRVIVGALNERPPVMLEWKSQ